MDRRKRRQRPLPPSNLLRIAAGRAQDHRSGQVKGVARMLHEIYGTGGRNVARRTAHDGVVSAGRLVIEKNGG